MKKRKYVKKYLVIILVIGIILIGGLSFAFWQIVNMQNDENLVTTGCFDLSFVEESEGIYLEKVFPIIDEEGMKGIPYTFTLRNTCAMYAKYQVNLEVLEDSTLSSSNVKAVLDSNIPKILIDYESVTSTFNEARESYKLITGKLKKDEEVIYNLRIWMDEDTSLSEGQNKLFKSKITVIAVPTEEPSEILISGNLKYIVGTNFSLEAEASGKAKNKVVSWSFISTDGAAIQFEDVNSINTNVTAKTSGSGILTVTTENSYSDSIEVTILVNGKAIYTANQLSSIGRDSNYPLNGDYILMNDIDLSTCNSTTDGYGATGEANCAINWTPIGSAQHVFTGSFDGGNYKISNLKINRPDIEFIGLFGYTSSYNKPLQNINIENAEVRGGIISAGILAGYAYNSTILNNRSSGIVDSKAQYAGGLMGIVGGNPAYEQSMIVSKNFSSANVSLSQPTGLSIAGGLFGSVEPEDSRYFYENGSIGNVSCSESPNCYVGGLIGNLYSGTIERSFSKGNVTSTYVAVGLIGSVTLNSIITDCYALGTITSLEYVSIGIIGSSYYGAQINTSYFLGLADMPYANTVYQGIDIYKSYHNSDTNFSSTEGGIGKSITELKQQSTYEGWDFDAVWNIDSNKNNGLPYLRWQDE